MTELLVFSSGRSHEQVPVHLFPHDVLLFTELYAAALPAAKTSEEPEDTKPSVFANFGSMGGTH